MDTGFAYTFTLTVGGPRQSDRSEWVEMTLVAHQQDPDWSFHTYHWQYNGSFPNYYRYTFENLFTVHHVNCFLITLEECFHVPWRSWRRSGSRFPSCQVKLAVVRGIVRNIGGWGTCQLLWVWLPSGILMVAQRLAKNYFQWDCVSSQMKSNETFSKSVRQAKKSVRYCPVWTMLIK